MNKNGDNNKPPSYDDPSSRGQTLWLWPAVGEKLKVWKEHESQKTQERVREQAVWGVTEHSIAHT